jgi:hypothetical protein
MRRLASTGRFSDVIALLAEYWDGRPMVGLDSVWALIAAAHESRFDLVQRLTEVEVDHPTEPVETSPNPKSLDR